MAKQLKNRTKCSNWTNCECEMLNKKKYLYFPPLYLKYIIYLTIYLHASLSLYTSNNLDNYYRKFPIVEQLCRNCTVIALRVRKED